MEVLATEQQVLSPDPRIAVRKETETTFLLTLRDITALDKGEYVCQVHPISMDEGTIKPPIPKCRLYWCFLFGLA